MKEWYMDRMMKKMTPQERRDMMDNMMDKFFANMTVQEKKEMMANMMPKMMDNMLKDMSNSEKQELMMSMMPQMMGMMFGGGNIEKVGKTEKRGKKIKSETICPMMPNMMIEMMPFCIDMMLPNIPKENRKKFVLKMTNALMKNCTDGMSQEEKKELSLRINEKIKIHLT